MPTPRPPGEHRLLVGRDVGKRDLERRRRRRRSVSGIRVALGLLALAAARCLSPPVSETRQTPAAPADPLSHLTFVCTAQICTAVPNTTPPPQAAIFERGEIDLTGDGIPERIERHGEALVILKEAEEVWRSPESWRVLDADLGDPNDDGRYEIMVAFWKDDADWYRTTLRQSPWPGFVADVNLRGRFTARDMRSRLRNYSRVLGSIFVPFLQPPGARERAARFLNFRPQDVIATTHSWMENPRGS